jgi:putative two-component system response regulator
VDALSSRRSYKEPWSEEQVLKHIRDESGRHFDPELVDIFFARLDEIRSVRVAHMGD